MKNFTTKPYKLAALREWNVRMSRFESPEVSDPVVSFVLRQQGFEPDDPEYKEPRSVYSVEKLYQQLEGFNPGKSVFVNLKDKHVQAGIRFAYSVFANNIGGHKLKPLKYYDESIISNWKGSSGLTAYGTTKREGYSRGLLSAERILRGERKPEPCLAFARTQKKKKTRLVWGYPYSMTILEGMIAKPLLSQFKGGCTPMAFAMTNKTLGLKMLSATNSAKYYYSLDASQFDSTIQKPMIHVAFNIVRTWFNENDVAYEGVTVGELIDIIEQYFTYTPIVMPTGDKQVRGNGILHVGKRHGVPSGSYFTQLVDSIVNIVVLGTICSKFGLRVNPEEVFVLGDDLLFFCNTHLDIKAAARFASTTFGMIFNEDKSSHGKTTEPVEFLGRIWWRGLPYRDTTKAVKKMVWPEKYRNLGKTFEERRTNAEAVIASYSLSAIQDMRLIPSRRGWSMMLSPSRLKDNAENLSGFLRYKTRFEDENQKNSGGLSLLKVLL